MTDASRPVAAACDMLSEQVRFSSMSDAKQPPPKNPGGLPQGIWVRIPGGAVVAGTQRKEAWWLARG
jgi:hypothetical protein